MWLEVLNAVATLAGVAIGAQFGPLWMCAGAGLGSCVRAVVSVFAVRGVTKAGIWSFFAGQFLPILACVPMIGAVLAARWALHRAGIEIRGLNLTFEIVAGGIGYVIAAFVVANGPTRDFLELFKSSLLPKFRRKSA
jgi:hypothetical protein